MVRVKLNSELCQHLYLSESADLQNNPKKCLLLQVVSHGLYLTCKFVQCVMSLVCCYIELYAHVFWAGGHILQIN